MNHSEIIGWSDLQLFSTGFYAYQQQDYPMAARHMGYILQLYPDSMLRDLVILWLSQALYHCGDINGAARHMSTLLKEYPGKIDLHDDVDEELIELGRIYSESGRRGE